ncbi:MAG: HAD-IIB family hydrolase [Deltaproteobacteria bacterium]|nr:HAD-IIB family hydrolase [Deltaproteobacteria bacterium]
MRSLRALPRTIARNVRLVFTDIDDTLTSDGLLEASAFAAMWSLFENGVGVVPVTGRPAGWCDHFARMWPVAGVIGENGAFYFRYDRQARRLIRRFVLDEAERRTLQQRLRSVRDRILADVPGAAVASDQDYRIHDLAIDYCEDVPPLSDEDVERIVTGFGKAGATAKVSSIHVNGWFGRYDKLGMIQIFAREVAALDLQDPKGRTRAIFIGDSPNDEPGFAFFDRTSVGVANVRRFVDQLQHAPAFVTRARGGQGFAELARALLRSRRSPVRRPRRATPKAP